MPNTSHLVLTLSYKIPSKKSEEYVGFMDFDKAKELHIKLEKELLEGMQQKKFVTVNLPTETNEKSLVIDCSTLSNFELNRTTN